LLLAALATASQAAADTTADGAASAPAVAARPAPVERAMEDLGIEFVALRLTAADYMVDLRYRVKDAEKSKGVVQQSVHPVLVNEATGDRYYVPIAPKIGTLRQTATAKSPVQPGKIYFMLFANPDRKLRVGEKVTLYAGDSVVKGLVVQ
jgi:hypothetical protein